MQTQTTLNTRSRKVLRTILVFVALVCGICFYQEVYAVGNFLLAWGTYGGGDGAFRSPWGVAVDSAGNVYVADTGNHRIQRFTDNGSVQMDSFGVWGSYGSGDGQFISPRGVATGWGGSIYVADTGNHRIQNFTEFGKFVTKWGSYGSGKGQFNDPRGVAADNQGDVYVADTGNDRIQKFDSSGNYLLEWAVGSASSSPVAVAVSKGRYVYVAVGYTYNGTYYDDVYVYDSNGKFMASWRAIDGLNNGDTVEPGVSVDGDGYVYVADNVNSQILTFEGFHENLRVVKSNNTNGAGSVGTPFIWTLSVANGSAVDTVFLDGQTILKDELPVGPVYGTPVVVIKANVTNGDNISCAIDGNSILVCTASGADVTIGNASESFAVLISVAPQTGNTLKNPREGGVCKLDPDWRVPENDEDDNNCSDTVTVMSDAEMDVQSNSLSIPSGDTTPNAADLTDFGSVAVDSAAVIHTFTIENTGTDNLGLSGSPRVAIDGEHAADFTVIADPYSPVAGGSDTNFVIQFSPSAAGLREATVSIANSDDDENPYTFTIQGTGAVSGDGDIKISIAGDEFVFGPVKLIFPQLSLSVEPVAMPTGGDALRLGSDGRVFDIIVRDYAGNIVSEFDFPLVVCIKPSAAEISAAGGNINLLKVYHNHAGGNWEVLDTFVDGEHVCTVVNRLSYFVLGAADLPNTGFPPGVATAPEAQPAEKMYFEIARGLSAAEGGVSKPSDFTLEIPALGLETPIIGVPLTAEGWDVSWLGERAGYLEGTAYPTWAGNTAITAHVWDADNNPGPFVDLHTLQHGDQVEIHAWGQVYTYEVREVMQVRPDDLRALPQAEYDVLTLITCQGYDDSRGEYGWRIAVRAVLMKVETE